MRCNYKPSLALPNTKQEFKHEKMYPNRNDCKDTKNAANPKEKEIEPGA